MIRLLVIVCVQLCVSAFAETPTPQEIAGRLYRSLTGVSLLPENPLYSTILDAVTRQDYAAAASTITNGAKEFYDVTLANFASPFNRDENLTGPANEQTAMIIGTVRDNRDIHEILTDDFTYTDDAIAGGNAYTDASNNHYEAISASGTFMSPTLTRKTRSSLAGAIPGAGIFTSRTFAESYYAAGTNRRPWMGIIQNLFCSTLTQIKNANVPDTFVRRDVPRAPGGDPAAFQQDCKACHGVMDAVTRAFAFMNFDGTRILKAAQVPVKVNGNIPAGQPAPYPEALLVTNDAWLLVTNEDQNRLLGFEGPFTGNGIRELGQTIANSTGFHKCMAKRVVSQLYLKKVFTVNGLSATDKARLIAEDARITQFANGLKQHRNLKRTFEEVAVEYLKLGLK